MAFINRPFDWLRRAFRPTTDDQRGIPALEDLSLIVQPTVDVFGVQGKTRLSDYKITSGTVVGTGNPVLGVQIATPPKEKFLWVLYCSIHNVDETTERQVDLYLLFGSVKVFIHDTATSQGQDLAETAVASNFIIPEGTTLTMDLNSLTLNKRFEWNIATVELEHGEYFRGMNLSNTVR